VSDKAFISPNLPKPACPQAGPRSDIHNSGSDSKKTKDNCAD